MTAPAFARCARCDRDLYPRTCRVSDEGWVCANGRACTWAVMVAARREDLAWMHRWGATREEAAARLGVDYRALEKWCNRHAADLWAAMPRWEQTGANSWNRRTA